MRSGNVGDQELWQAVDHRDRRTYLDAVDAERRRLKVKLVSAELLRKGETRPQRQRMRSLALDLAAQARTQMRDQQRRPFRGKVAVEIDLRAVGVDQPPASPPAVKAYLDLLKGIVYRDDSAVACLRVCRHAADNPWFRGTRSTYDIVYDGLPRIPRGPAGHVEVEIVVQPLRTYIADFDRVFDLDDLVFGDKGDHTDEPGHEFFSRRFDPGDDLRIDDLREEERDDSAGRGIYATDGRFALDADLRERLRDMRKAELGALRRKVLLGLGPDPLDRPGPLPQIMEIVWRGDPRIRELHEGETLGPGRFLLPIPPSRSGGIPWRETVRDEMTSHHGSWRMLDVLEGRALALEIAVRGADHNPRDLDNLARDIVGPFEEVFCSGERGSVASYRVHTTGSGTPGVRVLVIADERLEHFERAIASARRWVLARGPRFRGDD